MLKEVRKIKTRSKSNYIRMLMKRGKIPEYINAKGFICYDDCELAAYRKTAHRGRPPKK